MESLEIVKKEFPDFVLVITGNGDIVPYASLLDKYKHNMYTARVQDEDTEFAVKPMNCPGGVLIYKQ